MKTQLTEAEIKHLRLLLGWMRVEYCLDESMQRGSLTAIRMLSDYGDITQEEAMRAITKNADQIKQVPKYIRHGIKMLTKVVKDHDGYKGDVVDASTRLVQRLNPPPACGE